MLISGVIPQAGAAGAVTSPATLKLAVGALLLGRISQVTPQGQGVFRLPSGVGLAFTGGHGLKEGEQVQLEVVRTAPQLAMRVAASESGNAGRMAEGAERTLSRAPDLFSRTLALARVDGQVARGMSAAGGVPAGTGALPAGSHSPSPAVGQGMGSGMPATLPGGAVTAQGGGGALSGMTTPAGAATPPAGSPAATAAALPYATVASLGGKGAAAATTAPLPPLVTRQGEPLASLLQRTLPQLSAFSLMRGDASQVSRVLRGAGGAADGARQLKQEAAGLRFATPGGESMDAALGSELGSARGVVRQLGDLVGLQELLPRSTPLPDGGVFLGYRLFWLAEGGMGEAIWKQEGKGSAAGGGGEGEQVTTVLLSLTLSQLGMVQARLSYGQNQLRIGLAAGEEASLGALRERVAELRDNLQRAGLPLRRLDLVRLSESDMNEERQRQLGVAGGFAARV